MNIQARSSRTYQTHAKQCQDCCTRFQSAENCKSSLLALPGKPSGSSITGESIFMGMSDGLIKGSWQVACILLFGPSSVWHILLSVKNGNPSLSGL